MYVMSLSKNTDRQTLHFLFPTSCIVRVLRTSPPLRPRPLPLDRPHRSSLLQLQLDELVLDNAVVGLSCTRCLLRRGQSCTRCLIRRGHSRRPRRHARPSRRARRARHPRSKSCSLCIKFGIDISPHHLQAMPICCQHFRQFQAKPFEWHRH